MASLTGSVGGGEMKGKRHAISQEDKGDGHGKTAMLLSGCSPSPDIASSVTIIPEEGLESARACNGSAHVVAQGDEGRRCPISPASHPRRQKIRASPSPSSYVRAEVDGKPVVLSRYFPLPANASSVAIIPKKEVQRARAHKRTVSAQLVGDGEGDKRIGSSLTPTSHPSQKRKAPTPTPSSYVRARVDGETKVLSRYFPLPANASSVEVISKEEVKRAMAKKNKSPQLTAAEKMSNAYKRVGANNNWAPPRSSYNLLQENHYIDPWRVLIICMLLNKTSGKQVREVLRKLFCICPDAKSMAWDVDEEEIEEAITTLGLQKTRAKKMKRFSQEYLGHDWTHVTQLHGVGNPNALVIDSANYLHATREKVTILQEQPHLKGIINTIKFMPYDQSFFAACGCDHSVILWHDQSDSWKPNVLCKDIHSSAVTGVSGLEQRKFLLSVGLDKRVVAFDSTGKIKFKFQLKSKCLDILPNPLDFNLYMVHTGFLITMALSTLKCSMSYMTSSPAF
ncbi:hypothetical protein J5N97_022647 [Dioscorea zingiberensis]|uniref:Uncharacterized protein n=1 Tax=Dioscorea zingiberensis TaxID=325984 RepID=A0A9D5CBL6_9LILI|nr:hypothetical protein J5N97_022647 [Dioscorea zingiberensis]